MNSISKIIPCDIHQNGQDKNKNFNNRKLTCPTLQGVLLNKTREENNYEPNSSLIITTPTQVQPNFSPSNETVKSFDVKKALMPLIVGTIALFGATAGLSMILKHSAKRISETDPVEHLRDLAVNMNIPQEDHFATYMMIRNPNFKTIKGALGVFAMSGITLISKNFVDGVRQIWIKKQESDIQRDLQENLIETETKTFSGKLQIERNILSETAQYFDKIFNKHNNEKQKNHNTFKSIISFCGKNSDKKTSDKNNNLIYIALLPITALLGFIFGKHTFKNLKKTSEVINEYTTKVTKNSIDFINETVEKIQKTSTQPEIIKEGLTEKEISDDIKKIEKVFETISVKDEVIRETLTKINIPEEKIQEIIKNVEIKRKSIYANAPESFAGVTEKIQYYCYLDEDRGHLYNALMHPENKFTKYLFLAFTSVSAIGYITEQCVEAIKNVAVSRENANTELSLQKRLIDVELKNFQSKKNSAVKPLLEEFNKKLKEGTPEEDLKNMADNILMEIKNGAPFVYS